MISPAKPKLDWVHLYIEPENILRIDIGISYHYRYNGVKNRTRQKLLSDKIRSVVMNRCVDCEKISYYPQKIEEVLPLVERIKACTNSENRYLEIFASHRCCIEGEREYRQIYNLRLESRL